jgi:hypothetical protein
MQGYYYEHGKIGLRSIEILIIKEHVIKIEKMEANYAHILWYIMRKLSYIQMQSENFINKSCLIKQINHQPSCHFQKSPFRFTKSGNKKD